MSEPTPTVTQFPPLRPRRAKIQGGDGLTELAMPERSRSIALQTIGAAYTLLAELHGGDREEARRRIIDWLDHIDRPRGSCGNE